MYNVRLFWLMQCHTIVDSHYDKKNILRITDELKNLFFFVRFYTAFHAIEYVLLKNI